MPVLEKFILAAVIVLCALFAFQALEIKPPARAFPLFVSILTGAMAVLALARSVARPLTVPIFTGGTGRVVMTGAAGLVLYVVVLPVGYIPATLGFLFLGYVMLMQERSARSILAAALIALAATGFTWLCFAYWLGVNLP
ncbi:tripartite tricarboxylate transporter TctB family protein [Frigidibacter sp. ROC022]|uniref:tripartite tricarboxylate transporter TctB family protein n=1 Tax=Frigidibacter sp. ROC022 TaxID=2971796 RepID=UPI00215AA0E2|nr:tripartite tricarboxylate transporter TctB family protein [Frigidibacter sp. ROC022]MCR8726008.1 tripartite tricarboxylate transporter TctB family protein [Frigidibacter sp. ROC022]